MMKNMRRLLFVGLAGASLLSACAAGDDSGAETTASARSSVNPEGVVKAYLKGKGKGKAADQLRAVSQGSANGLTHLRLEQTVDGFRVHGVYAKASVDGQGNLVNMIDGVPGHSNHPSPASAREGDALAAALDHLGYAAGSAGAAVATNGNVTQFGRGNTFHRNPTVERVAYVDDTAGVFREGFLVETWSVVGNQLNHTLVDGKGKVLDTELRTNNDSYTVYKTDPRDPATTEPGQPGWLGAGAQTTHDIRGNNVHAYLDVNADNAPDSAASTGATAVTNGVFDATLEDAAPTTARNRAVAVQNLFYLNNVTHDTLLAHGFDAAAGNFEGVDAVNAEAQDGGGTDNANFSTPADGTPPRMQMYLWTGRVPNALVTGAPTGPVGAYQSSFGAALTVTGVGPQTVVVATPADGCTAVSAAVKGKIALVDRGTCDFTVKVKNAQSAGAIAVIIAQNTSAAPFSAGGTDRKVTIPSVMISQADRANVVGQSVKLVKNTATARQVDGDLDSGIVYHEYGHGLTWRMVGSMSGPLAGALGEGSSDVVAMLINDDPVMGAYAYSDALGIRRAPYNAYTLTYAAVTGAEVHNDGEIWAAAVWQVYENYQANGLDNIALLDDFVKSLNFVPAKPTFEQMRDGLVQQATLSGRQCLVWDGMASLGLGVGSKATLRGGRVTTTPSFAVPAACQ